MNHKVLRAGDVFPGTCINANGVSLIDEQGHGDLQARFQGDLLVHAGSRIPGNGQRRVYDS